MKDKDEFLKQMENLKVPDVNPAEHQKTVKMAIMNAERSAVLGVWLIVIPCYFLLCVFMYYYFHVHINWFTAMFTLLASMDKTPGAAFWGPLILVVLPIICIIINALAIIHVQAPHPGISQTKARERTITIKLKIWNILLILLSLAVVLVFINYVMVLNITVKN